MKHEKLTAVLEQIDLNPEYLARALEGLSAQTVRYRRLFAYYANPMRQVGEVSESSERPYRLAQEWGMPSRLTGYRPGPDPLLDGLATNEQRKEVVVQNDIAWRIDTGVDYLFGKLPQFHSTAADPQLRDRIDAVLFALIQNAGGIRFLQQFALLGSIYGFADIAITLNPPSDAGTDAGLAPSSTPDAIARHISLQVLDPACGVALLDLADAQHVLAFVHVQRIAAHREAAGPLTRLIERFSAAGSNSDAQQLEIWTPNSWHRFVEGELIASGGNTLGAIPVVHVQNTAIPFTYAGASDVEPLIPLQDELNVRLSDRAHRIAMQSFKMYLGLNVDLKESPPQPGRCWTKTITDADVKELGGDANCDCEDTHIAEIREAIDRVSGVPPVAAGAIRNRIGNLTSAAALRITLMSLLARTERKRALYGQGLAHACRIALCWLDAAGVFATPPEAREIEIHWPSPLPENDAEKLDEAKLKLDIGISKEVVLRELGY